MLRRNNHFEELRVGPLPLSERTRDAEVSVLAVETQSATASLCPFALQIAPVTKPVLCGPSTRCWPAQIPRHLGLH